MHDSRCLLKERWRPAGVLRQSNVKRDHESSCSLGEREFTGGTPALLDIAAAAKGI
jgi:hypothetical protein